MLTDSGDHGREGMAQGDWQTASEAAPSTLKLRRRPPTPQAHSFTCGRARRRQAAFLVAWGKWFINAVEAVGWPTKVLTGALATRERARCRLPARPHGLPAHLPRAVLDQANCRDRWKFNRNRACQMIEAAEVAENVQHAGQTVPANARQAAELAKLPEPEQQAEAWSEVVEDASGVEHPRADQLAPAATPWPAQHRVDSTEKGTTPDKQRRFPAAAIGEARRIGTL
jgi:hypothetical protein